MAWTIVLENEDKVQIHGILKELDYDALKYESMDQVFKLLKYLDPYGDTTFNNVQIDDLLVDLEVLKKHLSDHDLVDEIIALATKCKNEPHTYLTFYGD